MKHALVAAAILLSSPGIPRDQAERYAGAIERAAARAKVPPVLLVAIIERESHWSLRLVSRTGDVGLGQIHLANYAACRPSLDTPECEAVKARLMVGTENIAVMGGILRANRKLCGSRLDRLLAGYEGRRCKPGVRTRGTLARWRELERQAKRGRGAGLAGMIRAGHRTPSRPDAMRAIARESGARLTKGETP